MVHGAWGAAKEFDNLTKLLAACGHSVAAVDLPGHGNNTALAAEVTLDAYVQEVIRVVEDSDDQVVLVGHSLGGVVISQVAEIIPDKINRLIYIAAMLPVDGSTALEIMQKDGGSELLSYTHLSEDNRAVALDPEGVRIVMLNDINDEDEIARLRPQFLMEQPVMPLSTPVELSNAKFGSVPKFYVRANLDKVITPALQDQMIKNWAVEEVFNLESGHFPFFSMPEKLTNILCEIEEY